MRHRATNFQIETVDAIPVSSGVELHEDCSDSKDKSVLTSVSQTTKVDRRNVYLDWSIYKLLLFEVWFRVVILKGRFWRVKSLDPFRQREQDHGDLYIAGLIACGTLRRIIALDVPRRKGMNVDRECVVQLDLKKPEHLSICGFQGLVYRSIMR